MEARSLNQTDERKPSFSWQLWLVGTGVVLYLAFVAAVMLPLLGTTLASIAEVFSSNEPTRVKALAGLVLLGCLFLVGLLTMLMLSVPALYRGRPWGLFTAFGVVIVNLTIWLVGAVTKLQMHATMDYFRAAVFVLTLIGFIGMLLSPSVLRYFSLEGLSKRRIALSGSALGAVTVGLVLAAVYGITEVGVWLQR